MDSRKGANQLGVFSAGWHVDAGRRRAGQAWTFGRLRAGSTLICTLVLLSACGGSSGDELPPSELDPSTQHDASAYSDAGSSRGADGGPIDGGIGEDQDAATPFEVRMPAPPPESRPRTFDPPVPAPPLATKVQGAIQAFLAGPPPHYPPLPPSLPSGAREALCELRDRALALPDEPFGTLGLAELGRNYYCDGGCFMCCLVPANGGCHTSFDYSDEGNPPVNCAPGVYGAGTTVVGEALIYGDSLGLGICVGGVQQTCSHFPVCNGQAMEAAGASARVWSPSERSGASGAAGSEALRLELTASGPPHEDMIAEGAAGSRAKAYVKNLLHFFTQEARKHPGEVWPGDYVDLVTLRGTVDWRRFMREAEPFSGQLDVFRRDDEQGELLFEESYGLGILYWAQLALLGAVPNALHRLAFVESRYWSAEEKSAYLAGRDPDAELRRGMGPFAFRVLTQLPLADYRLLAVPAPGEVPWPVRAYHGVELGRAPRVTAAQDCDANEAVRLSIRIDDPYAAEEDEPYPVTIQWGDGTATTTFTASPAEALFVQHHYAAPGNYLTYVTTNNRTGLRGVAGVLVHSEGSGEPEAPVLATVALDNVTAYGPALVSAGSLALELEAELATGERRLLGWSAPQPLPNAGPAPIVRVVGHNTASVPFDALIVRPRHTNANRYDSVYLQLPSLTLGFYDEGVGTLSTRTVPLTASQVRVFYVGAAAPVPAELLEHDLNGRLIVPIDRRVPGLPDGFCGTEPCGPVDHLAIPITAELLGQRPASTPFVPSELPPGSVARWVEDVPEEFVPVSDRAAVELASACAGSVTVEPAAGEPARSGAYVTELRVMGPAVVSDEPVPLQALATRVDGRVLDVTEQVTWRSEDPRVLRVDNGTQKGVLSPGTIPGGAVIAATLGDLHASIEGQNERLERGYSSYRVVFTAIHGPVGRVGISGVELSVDGELLESLMTSASEGTLGPYAAQVSASSGGSAVNAFDASLGTGWMSANNSFATTEPYVAAEDVYLQVDFPHRLPVDGVRIHRQPGILAASFQPQFPRELVVLGSNDGLSFEQIASQSVENWDYEPVFVAF